MKTQLPARPFRTHILLVLLVVVAFPSLALAGAWLSKPAAETPEKKEASAKEKTKASLPEGVLFSFQDYLNRNWSNEMVTVPASAQTIKALQAGQGVVDSQGQPVLWQILPARAAGGAQVAFLANIPPMGKESFRLGEVSEPVSSDLKVTETDTAIEVSNSRVGLRIRKALQDTQGPIESIRLGEGEWIGESSLENYPAGAGEYSVRVVTQGPVLVEVECGIEKGSGSWKLRLQFQAGEPVVLIDEDFSLGEDVAWSLNLSEGFSPDEIFYRTGKSAAGTLFGVATASKIVADEEPVFVVDGWLRWWMKLREGKWFAVYGPQSPEMLLVGSRNAEVWVEPGTSTDSANAEKKKPADVSVELKLDGQDLRLGLPLADGRRDWLIGAVDKAKSLEVLTQATKFKPRLATLPQQSIIKTEFPLNRIKDYVLNWKETESHPRLFITPKELEELRKDFIPDPEALAGYMELKLNSQKLNEPVHYFLLSKDPALGRKLADFSLETLQGAIDYYLLQDGGFSLGFAPHHNFTAVATSANLADALFDQGIYTPEEHDRVRAQLAFIGYTTTRDDFWAEELGYAANPNMTSMVAANQLTLGCVIASNPDAKPWAVEGLTELKRELNEWSDSSGGWLEAPHYVLAAFDPIVGGMIMAKNSGYGDELDNPRLRLVAQWLAKISTPPNPNLNNWRHLPPIGNTMRNEATAIFGLMAGLWRERNPEFSAEMLWMHEQQGSPTKMAPGGFTANLNGFYKLLSDFPKKSKAPNYKSEVFPENGVILRNIFPSDRETTLHMIAGSHVQHYDYDSGSVTIWGKGRVIADDFGYYSRAPMKDHNMVDTPATDGLNMRIKDFSTTPEFDYVKGKLKVWSRQILFVKSPQWDAPNYFLIKDSLRPALPATWRMWFTCESIQVNGPQALVVGREDVDTDVFFVAPTETPKIEEVTRKTLALLPNRSEKMIDFTQTGLIVPEKRQSGFTTVLFPRLKTAPAAKVKDLQDGQVVEVQTGQGTDYLFANAKKFSFKQGEMEFEGTAGAIQNRPGKLILSLGAAGKISSAGKTLESEMAISQSWDVPTP